MSDDAVIRAEEPDFPFLQRVFKRRVAAVWLPHCRSLQVNTAPIVTRGDDGSPQQRRDAPNGSEAASPGASGVSFYKDRLSM